MSRFVLWLVACNFVIIAKGFPYLGPCDFVFKSIADCEGFTSLRRFIVSQKRYNRTVFMFDGDVITPSSIGDNLVVELKGSLKKDGGYKPGAFYLKDTVCKVIDTLVGGMMGEIMEAAGVEEPCPFPAAAYKVRDFYFDNSKFNVPWLYGEYKMEVFLYDGDVMDSCYVAYYENVPKERKHTLF